MSHPDRVTARLIEHIVSHRYETLAPDAVTATSTYVLDSLGVALAGSRVPLVSQLIDLAQNWGQSKDCRIWGTGQRVPAITAAFADSYNQMVRALRNYRAQTVEGGLGKGGRLGVGE